MTTSTIERIELFVVDPQKDVRWTDRAKSCAVATTVIRITDSDGVQGVAGMESFTFGPADRTTLEAVRSMWPWLKGRSIDCGEEMINDMRVGVVFPYAVLPLSLVDTALWDLKAKHAGLPLYRLLGGAKDEVPAYASLETMATDEHYVDVLSKAVSEGYGAVKLHAYGEPDKDIRLFQRLRTEFPELTLMHDAEAVYTHSEALKVGLALGELDCHWFEAPLNDLDLQGYRNLTARLTVPVIPAGYAFSDHRQIADALRDAPWSAARAEIASTTGITTMNRMMELAENFDMDLEPVTYGHPLYGTAGLHLILGHSNATYYEIAYPSADWEYGVVNPVHPDANGMVRAPEGDGLGIVLDWEKIESMTVHRAELG